MAPETLEACYQTLGLTPDAGLEEIKRAYRTLAKRWHPDRFAADAAWQCQAAEHFHTITRAYTTLRTHHAALGIARMPARWLRRSGYRWSRMRVALWCLGIGGMLTVGGYALPLARHPALPPAPAVQLSVCEPPAVLPQTYITLGSTKEAARAIQGVPTWATERVWEYGGSRLYFKAGRVTGWDVWPASPLKVQLLPAMPLDPVPTAFTIGSTKDEVLAVQGTPTRVTERTWDYGASHIFFADNRVTRWEVWPGFPLHVRLAPVSPPDEHFLHGL